MARGIAIPDHIIVYPTVVEATLLVPAPGVVAPKAINPVTISGTIVPSPSVVAPKIIVAVAVSGTTVPSPNVAYPKTVTATAPVSASVVNSPSAAHSARTVGALAYATQPARVALPTP